MSAESDAVICSSTNKHLVASAPPISHKPRPSFVFYIHRETHAYLLSRRSGPERAYGWITTRFQTTCEWDHTVLETVLNAER